MIHVYFVSIYLDVGHLKYIIFVKTKYVKIKDRISKWKNAVYILTDV